MTRIPTALPKRILRSDGWDVGAHVLELRLSPGYHLVPTQRSCHSLDAAKTRYRCENQAKVGEVCAAEESQHVSLLSVWVSLVPRDFGVCWV